MLILAMQLLKKGVIASSLVLLASAATNDSSTCPGYAASNVQQSGSTLTADLTLAGSPCNAYGTDLTDLKLLVEYQTGGQLSSTSFRAVWLTIASQTRGSMSRSTMPRRTCIKYLHRSFLGPLEMVEAVPVILRSSSPTLPTRFHLPSSAATIRRRSSTQLARI